MSRWPLFVLAAVVVMGDQLSKLAAEQLLRARPPVVLVPDLLQLNYTRNPGGLGGLFGGLGQPWHGLILTGLPALAILLLIVFLVRSSGMDRPTLVGFAFILGGAVGNVTDRLLYGEVIDFLDVWAATPALASRLMGWFGTTHWPIFNLADSAIVTGAILLATQSFRTQPEARPAVPE